MSNLVTPLVHQLSPMSLSAIKELDCFCPEHHERAYRCRTTWDARNGRNVARVIFSCGCQGIAPIKAAR